MSQDLVTSGIALDFKTQNRNKPEKTKMMLFYRIMYFLTFSKDMMSCT